MGLVGECMDYFHGYAVGCIIWRLLDWMIGHICLFVCLFIVCR